MGGQDSIDVLNKSVDNLSVRFDQFTAKFDQFDTSMGACFDRIEKNLETIGWTRRGRSV